MVHIYNKKVGTLIEIMGKGYAATGEMRKQNGYISRKRSTKEFMNQPVYLVERGRMTGKMFILMPSYSSTRFCWRQYLEKIQPPVHPG